MVSPFQPDADKLAAVRAAIPALGAGIYLNTGSVGPLPAETAAAMAEVAAWERDTGRGHVDSMPDVLQRLDEARAGVAAIMGTDVSSVALMHSTTDGMNAATLAVDWRAGDRAVTTRSEHGGGLGPLYSLRDRGTAEVTLLDVGDDGDDARTIAAFDAAITPGTRLVSLSHVAWTTGAVMPIAAVAEIAHARGALVVVDGAQAAGAIPTRFDETGADAYALPAQKWLLGPEGMGAVYIAPSLLDAGRLETSGYGRSAVVGMARSIAWLSMYVGLDWVHRRGLRLAQAAADRLAAIGGVEVLTPRRAMATLVTFRISGWSTDEAFEEISRRSFAIFRTMPIDALRISVAFFNSEDELERFAQTVELVAAHTPETIPPRRTLTIIGQGE